MNTTTTNSYDISRYVVQTGNGNGGWDQLGDEFAADDEAGARLAADKASRGGSFTARVLSVCNDGQREVVHVSAES